MATVVVLFGVLVVVDGVDVSVVVAGAFDVVVVAFVVVDDVVVGDATAKSEIYIQNTQSKQNLDDLYTFNTFVELFSICSPFLQIGWYFLRSFPELWVFQYEVRPPLYA